MKNKNFSVFFQNKIKKFNKTIQVDSDKSISIRSFLIGAISQKTSKIKNILESEDVFSTIQCLKELGVKIKKVRNKDYSVFGKGLGSLITKKKHICNCGNSGTLARLLIGILSTTPNIKVKIKGDHSLNKRNMSKLINLMNEFGAEFYPKNKFNFPLSMVSSDMPLAINYKAGVSAQLKSAVMLAGLNSFGNTNIIEINKSRNHTENILLKSSGAISVKKNNIKIYGKKNLQPLNITIPGDPSSAAFFTSLALLTKDSFLNIKNVGINPRRIGFYKILKMHGAKIRFTNIKKINNEFIGDLQVKYSKIRSIKASSEFYPSTADEYPILFVIAALTQGVSIFKGIGDLANKESSRAKEMQKILRQIGVKSILNKDQIKIYGTNKIKKVNKTVKVKNLGDHRICMATSCLSLLTGINSHIKNFETVNTSSPSYLKLILKLGGKFEIKK
tara:strand:+ start:629 stop:1966 length:1338 start_codon:yes stop_codon:yes gene_type:complete